MNKYYSDTPLRFDSVEVGDKLAPLTKRPSEVDVVRFCAAIRNFHRFHYDRDFTAEQGIETLLVPGFLSGNWCIEAASRAFAPGTEIARLEFRNTTMAPIAEDYLIEGEVAAVGSGSPKTVTCRLEVKRQATGETVTTGVVGIRPVKAAQT